ncbi:recombinase family protein [Enterocloster aldenensis]|uniref:recombinase family protein n=1 Tax=Enterocloster aldenensis TaxID=358742 RepID=UPI004025B1B0
MVVAGRINKVAFYCRMNHRNRDYTQFLPEVSQTLDVRFGKGNWEMQMFYEIASGVDPARKEFNRLKMELRAGNFDAVIAVTASKLSRDWMQFMDFMKLCREKQIEVITVRQPEDAQLIYNRIMQFEQDYFEGRE